MNLGTALVALKADNKALKKDLEAAKRDTVKATEAMQSRANATGKSFKAMWLAYAAGAAVVAATAMKAIKAASDLQETTNKFNVVFKGQQKIAESWAKSLVSGYAMSTREAKQHLSSIQDLLVPMGMAADAAGRMSFETVKLSADLASFNNLPTSQVILDIQSALVGNFETMKKYGVILNVAVVQQKALEMGLVKSTKELTAAHKAQAAYQIMVESSAAAIGDSERSIGSYARTVKEAQAVWEDFMAALGELILPVATQVLAGLNNMIQGMNELMDTIKSLMTLQGQWSDKTEEWTLAAATREGDVLAEALGPGAPIAAAGGGGAGAPPPVSKEAAAEAEAQQEHIEAMAIADANAKENLAKAQLEHDAAMMEFRKNNADLILNDHDAAKEAELAILSEKLMEKQRMEKKASDAKRKLWLSESKAQLNIMSNAFLIMSTMGGKYSKMFFRMYQASAIANATVAGVEAATHAWSKGMAMGGPALAAAFAATSVAYTAAQIAAIASQSMPTAPTGIGVSALGPGAASTIPGTELSRPAEVTEEEQGKINIYLEGDILADELYIEMLAEKISEAVEGNEVRLVSSEVRAT